jgi:hypothetical protein
MSMSVGRPPFTVNLGRRGTHLTSSLLGSGVSYRKRVKIEKRQPQARKHTPEVGWGILGILLVLCAALFFAFVFFGQS